MNAGVILALVGMVVMLLNNVSRRQVKQGRVPAGGALGRFAAYGDLVAFGLILAGLVIMYLQK